MNTSSAWYKNFQKTYLSENALQLISLELYLYTKLYGISIRYTDETVDTKSSLIPTRPIINADIKAIIQNCYLLFLFGREDCNISFRIASLRFASRRVFLTVVRSLCTSSIEFAMSFTTGKDASFLLIILFLSKAT